MSHNNIILQHWTGPLGELTQASSDAFKQYAGRIGADYCLVQGNAFREDGFDPPCQKMCILNEQYDEYDNVLMVDCDQLPVRGLTDNVFEAQGIGIFNEWCRTHAYARYKARVPHLFSPFHPYFAGSIYKLDRSTRIKMRNAIVEQEIRTFARQFHDEGIMHRLATLANVPLQGAHLDARWSLCSYYPITDDTKMIHIRPKIHPRPNSPRRPKEQTLRLLQQQGVL